MADYTYSSAPRRCGGSHTLTYPYRRNRLQHLSQGLYPTEEIQIAMKVGGAAWEQGPDMTPNSPVILEKPPPVARRADDQPSALRPLLKQSQLKPLVLVPRWEKWHPGHRPIWHPHPHRGPSLHPGAARARGRVLSTVGCRESGEDVTRCPRPSWRKDQRASPKVPHGNGCPPVPTA